MDYEALGKRVRRARNGAGMTQNELAEKLGISTSFLGHIERGTRKASLETVIKIANALNTSLDPLLADSLDCGSTGGMAQCTPRQQVIMKEMIQTIMDNADVFKSE